MEVGAISGFPELYFGYLAGKLIVFLGGGMIVLNLSYMIFMSLVFFLVFYLKRSGGLVFLLAFTWFVLKIPFYFLGGGFLPEGINPEVFTEDNYAWLVLIKELFVISALIPFLVLSRNGCVAGSGLFVSDRFVMSVFVVYFLLLASYFSSVGGVGYLWDNMFQRDVVIKGNAFYITFIWSISIFIVFSSTRYSIGVQFFIVLFLAAAIYLAYGGRSFSLGLFVFWFVCYYFSFGRLPFRVFSARSFVLVSLVFLVVIVTPSLRQGGVGVDAFFEVVSKNWVEIFQRLAVPQVEFLIVDHFSKGDFWFGRSWLDLMYAFCPISYCQDKPPMDDGVYLYNIYLYGAADVGRRVDDFVPSSYPFETWSIFYANFGFPGVLGGGFFMGLVLSFLNNMYYFGGRFFRAVAVASIGCVALNFMHFSNVYFFLSFIPISIFSFLFFLACFSSGEAK